MSLPAAIYIRMSTDKKEQEDSPERQRQTVMPYCQNKAYKVIGEYLDEGISGSKFEERPDFLRLLQDAEAGRFKVIVADKSSRLSRQDEWEFFEKVAPRLKRAGVAIDTVFDGLTNWDDFASGFMKTAFNSYQNSQFLKGISHEILSGSMKTARKGKNLGAVPYGYRSRRDDPDDEKSSRHLVIFEPEAEIVRWLFATYANDDVPMRHMVAELNHKMIPPPSIGKKSKRPRKHSPKWQPGTIRRILTNRKYVGTAVYGKTARGDFNRLIDGKLTPCKKGAPIVQNPEAEWIKVPGAHEAIVSQEVYDRVQVKLAANKGKGRKTLGTAGKNGHPGHLLSGMLICGHCGRTLHAKRHHDKSYYQCRKADFTDNLECGYGTVSEEAILGYIRLRPQEGETIFNQQTVDKHIAELTLAEEQRKVSIDPKRIDQLRDKIKKAKGNLVLLDADQIPDAKETIRQMQAEADKLETLMKTENDAVDRFKRTIEHVENCAKNYQELIRRCHERGEPKDMIALDEAVAGPAKHRAALLSWIKRITIHWTKMVVNGKNKYSIQGIVIETTWGEVADLYRQVLRKARRTPSGTDHIQVPRTAAHRRNRWRSSNIHFTKSLWLLGSPLSIFFF